MRIKQRRQTIERMSEWSSTPRIDFIYSLPIVLLSVGPSVTIFFPNPQKCVLTAEMDRKWRTHRRAQAHASEEEEEEEEVLLNKSSNLKKNILKVQKV